MSRGFLKRPATSSSPFAQGFFLMLCPLNFYHCRPHRIIKFVNINLFHVGFGSAFLFQFFYFFFAITLPFQRWSKNRKEWLGRHQVPSFLCKHWLQLGAKDKAGSIQANHQVGKKIYFHPLNLWFLIWLDFVCNLFVISLTFYFQVWDGHKQLWPNWSR